MDIMDLASKAIIKITKNYGKKIAKNTVQPEIAKQNPVFITGEKYYAGFSREEIMPDMNSGKTYYIAGHGSGHVMEGVLTPVYVHAMWLGTEDKGFIWVSADIIGLTRVEVSAIRHKLRDFCKKTGCQFINITATHSHSGIDTIGYWGKPFLSIPADGKDPDYMNMLFDKICKACKDAYENRTSGKLFLGKKNLTDAQFAKRPMGEMHDTLSRFRFIPDNGGEETWLLNFAGHPNSLGGSNRMLSGEYPYYMREIIKEKSGANVVYGNGAIGGLDMADFCSDDAVENIKLQGKVIADGALSIENEVELKPEIEILNQPFYLPIDNNVLTFLAIRKTMSTDCYPDSRSELGLALKSEMTYIKIGNQQILMLPGESFTPTVYGDYISAEVSATGKGPEANPTPLAKIANDDELIVFGVSNDMTGYVVPVNDFILHPTQPYLNSTRDKYDRSHYHETNSMGINTQKYISEEFADIMTRV